MAITGETGLAHSTHLAGGPLRCHREGEMVKEWHVLVATRAADTRFPARRHDAALSRRRGESWARLLVVMPVVLFLIAGLLLGALARFSAGLPPAAATSSPHGEEEWAADVPVGNEIEVGASRPRGGPVFTR